MDIVKQQEVLSALASKTRLRLLAILNEKELSCEEIDNCTVEDPNCDVGELVDRLGITAPSVSRHVKELRHAELIECEKDGRHVYCSLNRETLRDLARNLESLADDTKDSDRNEDA